MQPPPAKKGRPDLLKHKPGVKYRRLSHTKMLGGFSTVNTRSSDPETEETNRRMWYSANFHQSFFGITQNTLLYGKKAGPNY